MRALSGVNDGFHIDVETQHPRGASVGRAFCENGGRGIHVEPASVYAEALAADRAGEIIVQAVLGGRESANRFSAIPQTGPSAAVEIIVRQYIERGFFAGENEVNKTILIRCFNLPRGEKIIGSRLTLKAASTWSWTDGRATLRGPRF